MCRVCGLNGQVTFTPEGRAWNPAGPTTGDTANTALLAAIYGQVQSQYITKAQRDRYVCFARGQMRYVLGDKGHSLMVGNGQKSPTHAQVGPCLLLRLQCSLCLLICMLLLPPSSSSSSSSSSVWPGMASLDALA